MKNRVHIPKKTTMLFLVLLLLFGMEVCAAPSVEGDTELTAVSGQVVSAEYTIKSDEDMEGAELRLSYDKDVLTYMSGSGGNNFSGSGGNGAVQLSSKPGSTSTTFAVKFKCKSDQTTAVEITSCIITVKGEKVDVLKGEDGPGQETEGDLDDEEDDDAERASWVIDERTFYLHNPGSLDDFESEHMEIQGIDSRVLKHTSFDLYVIRLFSDNGSYRDHFVYNPDTGNVIPFVKMESGNDDVIFIEPDSNTYVPTRYVGVDLGWGAKYTIPAYKHVIIDGIDEIFDDTNRYLIYGINQDGEKAWYSFDYDKNSLQLFDDVAYQGEQNYIEELETNVTGQKAEAEHLRELYNTNMGRRLTIIMVMTILIIVLINAVVLMYLRMRKMRFVPEEEEDNEEEETVQTPGAFVTGSLEEDETDFNEPDFENTEEAEIELEIIDLDDMEDDE